MMTLRKLWAPFIGKVEEHPQQECLSGDEYAHQLAIHLGRSKQALRMASGQLPDPDLPNPFVSTSEPPSKIWVYGTGVTDYSYRGWDVQSLDPSEVYYHIPDELVERLKLLENITIVPAFAKDSLLALLSIDDGES